MRGLFALFILQFGVNAMAYQVPEGWELLYESPQLSYRSLSEAQAACDTITAAHKYREKHAFVQCEPLVDVQKVRYHWTEVHRGQELAGIEVDTYSSSRSGSYASSGSSTVGFLFRGLTAFASSAFSSSGSYSSSYSSRNETPIIVNVPVKVKMYKDQEQVRLGIAIIARGTLVKNEAAPELLYDGKNHNYFLPTFQAAVRACIDYRYVLYGFGHVGKCVIDAGQGPEQNQFTFSYVGKPAFLGQ